MFIVCLAVTLKSLCTTTSDPAEDKYRVVGTLVILRVNNIMAILPMVVHLLNPDLFYSAVMIWFTLILHCPLMDFLLLVFISKWLLMCLCCCKKRNPAVNNSNRSDTQQGRQLSSEPDMKRETEGDQV
ncbi:hypothetical protein ILYODFUR_022487 [Ilyodon furcidens]|uniref:Uncharacterized protein n=1 Tax=Ilyodon furcidens TaxID=33524 RepID=A0ABV0VGT1_9TELE